jgi:hypothetical protein
MKFGGVMNQLNPALKRANENFAQSYKVVSMVGFRWKVLQVNMESLFTSIAYRAAPALNGMAVALTKVVQIADWLIQRTDKIPGFFNVLLQGAALATAGRGAQLAVHHATLLGKLIPDSGSNIGPSGALPKKASAWERMGLVIGGGGPGDRTNALLRESNKLLDKIHKAIAPRIPQGAQPLNPGIQHNLPRA